MPLWACANGTIGYNRALVIKRLPEMDLDRTALRIGIAHEAGHIVLQRIDAGLNTELRADCMSGVYMGVQDTPRDQVMEAKDEFLRVLAQLPENQIALATGEFIEGMDGDTVTCTAQ